MSTHLRATRSRLVLAAVSLLLLLRPVAGSAADCNLNGSADDADIGGGASLDCQGNGVPDECDLFPVQYDASSAGVGDVPAAIAVADTFPGALVAVARLGDDSVRLFSEVAGVLTPGAIVPVGARPEAVLAGRLRAVIVVGGDLPDLVTANANDGTVSILSEGLGGTYADITGSPFALGGTPNGLAVGDLTGEGDVDIVVTDRAGAGGLRVLVNDGVGSFTIAPSTYATGANPRAVVLADVDQDGDLDAVVGARGPGEVVLLENNAGVSFLAAVSAYAVGNPIGLDAADVDADGDIDLAVLSASLREVHVLENDGAGSFSLLDTLPVGLQPLNVRFADLDGNGAPDLLVASAGDDAATAALNLGTGSFGPPVNLPVGDGPVDVAAIDLDADGQLDVVTADVLSQTVTALEARRESPDCDAGGVPDACELAADDCDASGVLDACEGAGGRGFGAPLDWPSSRAGRAIAGGDFDGDGHGDALLGTSAGVAFFRGQADGSLVEGASFVTGGTPEDVLTADLDGDGHLDVVVSHRSEGTLAILRGGGGGGILGSVLRPTTADPATLVAGDLDRDGDLDLAVKGLFTPSATVLFLEDGAVDSSATVSFAAPSSGLAFGDADGDGHGDLLSRLQMPGGDTAVQIVRNEGGGTLTPLPPVLGTTPPDSLLDFAADDLDGDGVLDLAVLTANETGVLRLQVAPNDGAGAFAVSQSLPVTGGIAGAGLFALSGLLGLATGDADVDGDRDVLLRLGVGRSLRIHANDGAGVLALAAQVPVGRRVRDFALSDVDGDGAPDLALSTVLASGDGVTVLRNLALPTEGVCFGTCLRRPAPACIEMERARLSLSERTPGKEKWRFSLQSPLAPVPAGYLGDPVAGETRLGVCLYDEADALVGGLDVDRGGDACGPRGQPCWKATGGSGFRYKDPDAAADGVRTIRAASRSSERTRLSLQAANNAGKGQTALPVGIAAGLQDATSARVQLLTTDGACFDATLADVRRADGAQFEAKSP